MDSDQSLSVEPQCLAWQPTLQSAEAYRRRRIQHPQCAAARFPPWQIAPAISTLAHTPPPCDSPSPDRAGSREIRSSRKARPSTLRGAPGMKNQRDQTAWKRIVSAVSPGPKDIAQPACPLWAVRISSRITNITVAEDMFP